ncbi:MAG TPA: 1-acyl-sn-glycerol-3-phosphate acyltransferase, partial [Chitinophagales bacterium]|nr:1-acyl-sn-glycerol-3-phosphate acyltransferase [Chitinophagales bacterium]
MFKVKGDTDLLPDHVTKRYDVIEPDITKWPIYRLSAHRYEFIEEVKKVSFEKSLKHFNARHPLMEELARTVYYERIRLAQNPWKADPEDEQEFWNNVKNQLVRLSGKDGQDGRLTDDAQAMMKTIISRYANEIAGNFDPSIYDFAKVAIPFGISRLLNSTIGKNFKQRLSQQFSIHDRVILEGDIETIRELAKQHTLVMVPTHISNIDSIVIGWAIQEIGLPAFIYGAGLNLFGIRLLAYFMNRLGAYKVDRRKKNLLYLETLKTYSTLALHRECHSLFFPGGTRSRSGAIERHLKLGLLGTTFDAQYLNYVKYGDAAKKIIVIPVVMNYHFVLEAPNLIEEHLKKTGREFYLMEKPDSLSTSVKIVRFLIKFLTESSRMYLSFAPCMDLFGNTVDKYGISHDRTGKPVDVMKYFITDGELKDDHQRNEEYVKLLGEIIVERYHRYNIVMTSQLVAFTAFEMIRKNFKKLDVFGILRLPPEDTFINYAEFV